MNKKISVVLLLTLVFIFTGCNFKNQYKSIYDVYVDIPRQHNKIQEIITQSFKEENTKDLINIFSSYHKKNIDLEEQINNSFEFIDGDIKSMENKQDGSGGESIRKGITVKKDSYIKFYVQTDTKQDYIISVYIVDINKEKPQFEGVNSIYITHIKPDPKYINYPNVYPDISLEIDSIQIGKDIDD